MQISFENIWSAQPKHAGVVKRKFPAGFRFPDFRSHSRRKSADGSQAARWLDFFARFCWLRIGQIDAHDGGCLGEPVAFKNLFLEALLKMTRKVERQFFRAGNDQPQSAELFRFGFAQVQSEERRRRE